MRVLSVLAVLVAVAKAGDLLRNNRGIVSSGSSSGVYDNNLASGAVSYSAPLSNQGSVSGNFVGDVFSGYGNQGGAGFSADAVFGQGQRVGQSLGGDIFAGGSAGLSGGAAGYGGSAGFGAGAGTGAGYGGGNFGAVAGFQRGTAQASILDQAADLSDRRDDTYVRDAAQQEEAAARKDQQVRQGEFREAEQDQRQFQEEGKAQNQNENFKQQAGRWNLDSRRQNDQVSKSGVGIAADGELIRKDVVANDGAKALGVKKTAFTNGNLGFEDINYNFDKDFDQVANERGGYKEVTGRDNNNVQVYREKQRDHRLANSDNEAFRRANDLSRNANSQQWLQNALQKQGQNNQYGNADKLQDAAAKKAEDFNTFFDKRDDRVWNADRARDNAFRGAEDLANKNGLYNKDAIALSNGRKGVADNKYYGGAELSGGGGVGVGGGVPYGYGTAGVADPGPGVGVGVGGKGVGVGGGVGGRAGYDDRIGLQGAATGQVAAFGAPGGAGGSGRLENSGGDILNAYNEQAVQGDLANQVSNNAAISQANAANQYLRDKGLEDSVQLDQANQGRWANQREGFRDARQQGYNGDNVDAARAGEAIDNAFSDSTSRSNLDAANKNFDQAKLDRINLKSNQVDSNQNIRSKKQFYHDKNQGGFNNEGLNYNRRRGNNDFGAQEAAQKEARNRFSNLKQDDKSSIGRRRYEDQDARQISNGDAIYKQENANNGNAASSARARDNAVANAEGFKKDKARQEFDSFSQLNNQQNQKLWDRANRDFVERRKADNLGRRTDAAFQFGSDGGRGTPVGFSSGAPSNALGASRFGQTPLGLDNSFYTSTNSDVPGRQVGVQAGGVGGAQGYYGNNALTAGNTNFGNYW